TGPKDPVAELTSARAQLRQVVVFRLSMTRHGATPFSRLGDDGDEVALMNEVPLGHMQGSDHSIDRALDGYLHLHRLEDRDRLPGRDLVADAHFDLPHVRGE